jgi:hypothetical protein
MLNIKLERRGLDLHIIIPVWGQVDARESSTGRSTVLASTEGAFDLRPFGLQGQGPVLLEVNLYIPRGQK